MQSSVALRRLLLVVMLACLPGMAAPCGRTEDEAEPAHRIMPLGDDITEGAQVPGGYRAALRTLLVERGEHVDFVGSLAGGPDSLDDKEHEGHDGFRIDRLAAALDPWLTEYRPNTILLMIGTQDVVDSFVINGAPGRLDNMLQSISDGAPWATTYVASIPPLDDKNANERAQAFNSRVQALVEQRKAAGGKVLFVDVNARLAANDLIDGVHPSEQGHRKIADAWAEAFSANR